MYTNKITIQTTVSTDRQSAWDLYTQPEHITQWNFATDDWQCPSASNDLTVGGLYSARMEAKDGSFGFDFEARYDAIVMGESFQYTMADGRQVHVSFESHGDQTRVVVVFDAENQNPIEMQKDGWQAILDNYARYTEKHKS